MVGVLMGDQNCGEVLGSKAHLCQRTADPPAGDTHVNEQMGAAAGEQRRITGGAAGKGAKSGNEKVASLWKVKSPITMTLSGGNGQKRFVSSHC